MVSMDAYMPSGLGKSAIELRSRCGFNSNFQLLPRIHVFQGITYHQQILFCQKLRHVIPFLSGSGVFLTLKGHILFH